MFAQCRFVRSFLALPFKSKSQLDAETIRPKCSMDVSVLRDHRLPVAPAEARAKAVAKQGVNPLSGLGDRLERPYTERYLALGR